MKLKTILIAVLFTFFNKGMAQTGSLDVSITFKGESRTLSCYVPSAYDASKAYSLMICLHGLGDKSSNYRNALVNTFKWPSYFENTILICPDGGSDKNKDFYQPVGDEGIIAEAINYAVNKYSIAKNQIILQGFSMGGRSALKYGLDNPGAFKGLLINTPAIQGLADLDNKPVSSLMFNYSNSKKIPIYISVGEQDYTYFNTVQKLISVLKKNNAMIMYAPVANMGHTIAPSLLVSKSLPFFERKHTAPLDADLFELDKDIHFCNQSINHKFTVRNNGDSIIRSLNLSISEGGFSKTMVWKGILHPNEHVIIPFTVTWPTSGFHKPTYTITNVNGKADDNTTNNTLTNKIEITAPKALTSITEDFESPEIGWTIQESGSAINWYLDSDVKKAGTNSFGTFNTILMFNTLGYKESFTSPFIDVSALTYKELNFDLAFNYHKYTPPYMATETVFSDTLEVLISTDCGVTFTPIYRKGGKELATTPQPILNPLSLSSCFFTPKQNEWRKESINLSKYASAKNAILKFNCISGLGGSLNIDNIHAGSASAFVKPLNELTAFSFYPNPANSLLNVQFPYSENTVINLYDMMGKKIFSQIETQNNKAELFLQSIESGIYTVEIISGSSKFVKKLVVNQ